MAHTGIDHFINLVDSLWGYIGFPTILLLGVFLTMRSKFVQLREFKSIFSNFITSFRSHSGNGSIHPIRAFFASVAGSLGIGNVVAITSAVAFGGPGAIVWVWVTAVIGSLIKYSEVFLGMKTRIVHTDGTLRGGPMYFLQQAFSSKIPSILFCIFMCLYSVEVYQFGVVSSITSQAIGIDKWWTVGALLLIVIFAETGGLRRVSAIASCIVPAVVLMYVSMGSYVLFKNIHLIPAVFGDIFHSAFSSRAAEGGFIGSTFLLTVSQGVRSGCYSTDIGVGYASIIHSASSATSPSKQASLLIFEVFMDTFFVCTMSVLLVLVTGTWNQGLNELLLVQEALGKYFPHMNVFMPLFLSLLGYSVISTYFAAGARTASFLMPVWGRRIYYSYAIIAFLLCTFIENRAAGTMMSFVGFCLLVLNASAIFRLRKSLSFAIEAESKLEAEIA